MSNDILAFLIVSNIILSFIIIPVFIGGKREIGYLYSALACVFLSPLVGLIITLSSKKTKETLEKEYENSKEFKKNLSVKNNLSDLKEKGILSEEEYKQKTQKIESEKAEQNLKNSTEYKQLKSLLDSGVLTKDEFESKVALLRK
uniref:SHOCT domain-containing protein n=1 Tax=Flavobacterium sp. TaxID=239 RepID=UPI00404A5A48